MASVTPDAISVIFRARLMRVAVKFLVVLLLLLATLGLALAVRIYTWGRPLPVVYRQVSRTPAGAESGHSVTYWRTPSDGGGSRRYVAVDSDNDGTVDVVLREGSVQSFARPQADDPETRWLVLCLDGIPYGELEALWQEGYFREFFRPVPLISPFPTASGVALSEAFHTDPVQGYEDGHFNIQENRLVRGETVTTTGEKIPYLELLDYDMPGTLKGPAYILPHRSYRADLGRFRKRFLQSQQKVYLAHVASSDSLYHILPADEMRRLLVEVDALLRELYLDAGGKLRITVFSDHGNSLARGKPVPLRDHLDAGGWRLGERCGEPRTVVVPAYGLMGFFAVYCAGEQMAELASHLAKMEGVDLIVYTQADGVVIENAAGRAYLSWRTDGSAYRYQTEASDPLQLSDILAGLAAEGKADAEGWVVDADLFAATRNHLYPDAAFGLRQWALNHVRNRSDLVASLRPGWHQGSRTFERIVTMLSTHGSLDRDQSLGFAMSTDGPLDGPIRSGALLPPDLGGKRKAAGY